MKTVKKLRLAKANRGGIKSLLNILSPFALWKAVAA